MFDALITKNCLRNKIMNKEIILNKIKFSFDKCNSIAKRRPKQKCKMKESVYCMIRFHPSILLARPIGFHWSGDLANHLLFQVGYL